MRRIEKFMNSVIDSQLLQQLYDDAIKNLENYKSLSDEEREEIALETAEELFVEMSYWYGYIFRLHWYLLYDCICLHDGDSVRYHWSDADDVSASES